MSIELTARQQNTEHSDRIINPGQLPFSKILYSVSLFIFLLKVQFRNSSNRCKAATTLKCLEKIQSVWTWNIHMVMTRASGTENTQRCLTANLRDIRFFGRQMIITYGQICKCDFTLSEAATLMFDCMLHCIQMMKLSVVLSSWNTKSLTLESFEKLVFEWIFCVLCKSMQLGFDSMN